QDLADGVGPAARADDGHAAGMEELANRSRLGAMLAPLHDVNRSFSGIEVQLHLLDAGFDGAARLVTHFTENLQHSSVVGQNVCGEPADPPLPSGLGEVLQ